MQTGDVVAGPGPSAAVSERVYYPELDGLRFVAFLAVYVFHGGVPQFGRWVNALAAGLTSLVPSARPWLPLNPGEAIRSNGWIGVQFFFILSGYLISTLLLREEARYGRISLRAFWVRRILRIWPLYYLTLTLAFFALPWFDGVTPTTYGPGYGRHLPAFLVFAGNWSMALLGPVGNDAISILWSVCIEEQFYVLAPLLVAFVPPGGRLAVVVALMASAVAGRYALARAEAGPLLFQYNMITHLDTLLSGVLLALVWQRFPPDERTRRRLLWMRWPLGLALIYLLSRPGLAHGSAARRTWDFVGLWVCGVGVVALARVGGGWLSALLANPRLVWLGRISYGLYMYHEIALWLSRRVDQWLGWFPNKEPLMAIGSFAATVLMAAVSYLVVERPFLKLKRGWTRVPSRPI
ncbi:MAG: acyltransferase [Isosphaeraceae bacterium]